MAPNKTSTSTSVSSSSTSRYGSVTSSTSTSKSVSTSSGGGWSNVTTRVIRNGVDTLTLGGNKNHQKIESQTTPNVVITGDDNSIQTAGSTGSVRISGKNHQANIGMNSGEITLTGDDHEVIIQGNVGHLIVSGNDFLVYITGNVGSITVSGNDHDIRVGGDCSGLIRLGTAQNDAIDNTITIGGTAPTLRIDDTSSGNEVKCQRIGNVVLDGSENRVKAQYGKLVDRGEKNVYAPRPSGK